MAYKMVPDPKISFTMMGQATFKNSNKNGKLKWMEIFFKTSSLNQDLVVFMLVSKKNFYTIFKKVYI